MANTFTYLNKEVKMICDSKSDTSATRQNCAATPAEMFKHCEIHCG